MKLKADSKSLSDAISWATKNYDKRDSGAQVLLEVRADGNCTLSCFGETFLSSRFDVTSVDLSNERKNQEIVSYPLDGQFVQRLSATLPKKGEVLISSSASSLNIATPNGRFTAPVLSNRPKKIPETRYLGEVDDNVFFALMQRLARACSTEEGSNPALNSVDLGFENNDTLRMFSTDKYAMVESRIDFSPADDNSKSAVMSEGYALVPHRQASMISPTKGITAPVSIIEEVVSRGSGRFGYEFGDGRMVLFPLLDAKRTAPATIESIKSTNEKTVKYSVTAPLKELVSAVRTVANLSWEENDIKLTGKGDSIYVSDLGERNKIKVQLADGEFDDEEFYQKSFVITVLLGALTSLTSEYVRIGCGPNAYIFNPVNEDQVDESTWSMAAARR